MSLVECTTLFGGKCVPAERLAFRPSAYAIIRHEERFCCYDAQHRQVVPARRRKRSG